MPEYAGICAGPCGRRLPVGYLFMVTRWERQNENGFVRQVPVEMYCRDCSVNVEGRKQYRRKRMPAPKPPKLDIKAVAVRLYSAMSTTDAYGSHKIAKLANVEYSDLVLKILKKLRGAGKVTFEEGRWRRL